MDSFNVSEIQALEEQILSMNQSLHAMKNNVNVFYNVTMAIIIFLMQCGFAFLEAGSVRSKNATNILIKNVLVSSFSAVLYWICGWAFAFGYPSNPFIGYGQFCSNDLTTHHLWFFQFTFAANAATIVSGSVAERCEFVAYAAYTCLLCGFVYPVISHWAWAHDGWLKTLGYVFAALGGFILIFGFFAFNGGSQLTLSKPGDGLGVALAVKNTVLCGAFAAFATLIPMRILYKTWSLLDTLNGALTGMVAICASCNAIETWSAAVIGVVSGFTYYFWSFLLKVVKIDDPLNAFPVHFGGGLWGVIASPIFDIRHGIIFHWGQNAFRKLAWNIVGGSVIIVWCGTLSVILFGLLKFFKLLRVSMETELKGLDIVLHGEPSYPLSAYGHGWGGQWDEIDSSGSDTDAKGKAYLLKRNLTSEHPELEWHLKHNALHSENSTNAPRKRTAMVSPAVDPPQIINPESFLGPTEIHPQSAAWPMPVVQPSQSYPYSQYAYGPHVY